MEGIGNSAACSPKKKLARKPRHMSLSASAKKRKLDLRRAAQKLYGGVIRISEQQTRWDALKLALGLRIHAHDAGVAKVTSKLLLYYNIYICNDDCER